MKKTKKMVVTLELVTTATIKQIRKFLKDDTYMFPDSMIKQIQVNVIKEIKK